MKIAAAIMILFSLFLSCCGKTAPIDDGEIRITDEATLAAESTSPAADRQTTPDTEPLPSETCPQEEPDPAPTVSRDFPPPVVEIPLPQAPETPEPEIPTVPIGQTEPAPTEQTTPIETAPIPSEEPEPTEQTEPAPPAVCQHSWVPIQNIPAQYETHHHVVCRCGAVFSDTTAWAAHRDGFLGSADLTQHTGYATGSSKTETAPAMVLWQCSRCKARKTISALENP